MIGIILYLIASICKMTLTPFLYCYGFICAIKRKELGRWHKYLAIAKDQYGNVIGKYAMNDLIIDKRSEYKFGNVDETISSVIGKNKRANTLTSFGKKIDWVLDKIDSNHSINAIEEDEK